VFWPQLLTAGPRVVLQCVDPLRHQASLILFLPIPGSLRSLLLGRSACIVGVVPHEDTWKERTMQRQNVEFAVEGDVILRGWLFVPAGVGPHPAITIAHGFAGVKDHGLERFTRAAIGQHHGGGGGAHDARNDGQPDRCS